MQNKFYGRVFVSAHLLWNIIAAQNGCNPKDCYDLKCLGISTGKDGPHTIYPGTADLPQLQVSCDQETDGGGWIIYQRRLDGSVNFTRNWHDYKHGFGIIGNDTKEMWLGNENVYQLLQAYGSTECELRYEAHSFDGDVCWAKCYPFQMSNEAKGYTLSWKTVDESKKGLTRDLSFERDTRFTTFDKVGNSRMCLDQKKGGWWYRRCGFVFFNGVYIPAKKRNLTSIYWDSCNDVITLQTSCMMFRPKHSKITCNNPCKNNGTCEYVAAAKRYLCKCPSDFCGNICETAKTCKGGTCEYDTATATNRWNCVDDGDSDDGDSDDEDSTDGDSDDEDSTDGDSDDGDSDDGDSSSALVFGVIILGLIALLAAGAALMIFLQRRKRQQEEEAAAEQQRSLDEQARLEEEEEDGGFFSLMGW